MSTPAITRDHVRSVARLARLRLDEHELETFTEQLATILAYVKQLDELETADVEETSHVVPLACPLRPDRPAPGSRREPLLEQAPCASQGHFQVPKIID